MSGYNPETYIENQRSSWNEAACGWEKWDKLLESNMSSCDHHLISKAQVTQGHHVLDLGSGTGYPALRVAAIVGDNGSVTGLDLSGDMLAVARKKSELMGVGNVTFHECDVSSIPHRNESFDVVTSRFCLMFLPDVDRTLGEIHRVLKNGGRLAAAVWGPIDRNPSLSAPMKILGELLKLPPPDPSAPGVFSLAKQGALEKKMKAAGFDDVAEEEIPVQWRYSSGSEYVDCMMDMAAPVRALFSKLDGEKRVEARRKIAEEAERYSGGGEVRFPGVAIIASGVKRGGS